MAAWDRRSPTELARLQSDALADQVGAVARFAPWWRERLRPVPDVRSPEALAALPAAGERDVCPDGDPAGAAGLVLQPGEAGFARVASGPLLRRALTRRLVRPDAYRRIVEQEVRPTSYVWAGLGLRFPLASTRSDLDLVARAGARLWQVLGLSSEDVVVTALPGEATAARQALSLAALASGAPLLAAGEDPEQLGETLRLVPATVLALPSGTAADLLTGLGAAGVPLSGVATLLLVGAPYDEERAAARTALEAAGAAPDAVTLAVHVPEGHRLLWGECRPSGGSAGLHTYPDLELLQAVAPETGDAPQEAGPVEPVVTQLGFRGSALVRWRTGDLAEQLTGPQPCPACGRSVPRLLGVRAGALVPVLALADGDRAVDLRAVGGALAGRPELADWRVQLGAARRGGGDELLVLAAPAAGTDPARLPELAVALAGDLQAAAGLLPTQIVLVDGPLTGQGSPITPRVLDRGSGVPT